MSPAITILLMLSGACSLAYGLVYTHRDAGWFKTLVKTIPLLALSVVSWLAGGVWLLTLALFVGAWGDAFLSRPGTTAFIAGLGSFLVGHSLYALAFLKLGSGVSVLAEQTILMVSGGALIVVALIMLKILLPHLGALKVPVVAYIAVSVVMGMLALPLPFNYPLALAVLGAGIFIASDAILSFELFILPKDAAIRRITSPLLWFLYYGGQACIAAGILIGTSPTG